MRLALLFKLRPLRPAFIGLLLIGLVACGGGSDMPAAPTNVNAVKTPQGMLVTWTDNSSNELGFRVYRYDGLEPLDVSEAKEDFETEANTTEFTDSAIDRSQDYTYRVQAFNELGVSSAVGVGEEPDEAPPPEGQARLIVQRSGSGKGQIVSEPAGIACDYVSGENCSAVFDFGIRITLQPQADPESVFNGWEGACTGGGPCSLTISPELADDKGNIRVTANIRPLSATLSINKQGIGGTVIDKNSNGDIIDCGETCSVTYSTVAPVIVVLEAVPAQGSSFRGWGAPCEGQTGDCRVTIDQDIELNALFGQPAPDILSFNAAPDNIQEGQEATLSWQLSGEASGVRLSALSNGQTTQLDVPAGATSLKVRPATSTTYSLVAVGEGVESEPQDVTVTVNDAPSISSFAAEDDTVVARTQTTLNWSISGRGVTGISLRADGKEVDRDIAVTDTSVLVRPNKTTVYTLVVATTSGPLERQTTVTVGEAPDIKSFEPEVSPIGPGKRANLTWEVEDATQLSINNDIGVVTGGNVLSNELSATTVFELTASNDFGVVTEQTTVEVDVSALPKPKIVSFGVRGFAGNDIEVVEGEGIFLEWNIENQEELTDLVLEYKDVVLQLDNPKTLQGIPTNVLGDTSYTLSAIAPSGTDVSETIKVEVLTPAAIATFEAPDNATLRERISLSWTGVTGDTENALLTRNGLPIRIPNGAFPDGEREVGLGVPILGVTTFVLTVPGEIGNPVSVEQTVNVTLLSESELPNIASFEADDAVLSFGEQTTLRWDIPNQDTLTRFSVLRDTGEAVTLDDPQAYSGATVQPNQTTTYTLELENEEGITTSEPVTVTVENPDPNFTDDTGLEAF